MATKKVDNSKKFSEIIKRGYDFKDAITLGTAILNDKSLPNTLVKACLSTLNRHGLIAGATGTGKTRSLQKIAESLSNEGCPVLLMDIKGDLSGLAQPGSSNSKIEQRHKEIGIAWHPSKFPVEFLTISKEPGVRLRITVSEFGPILFSRILELNETQASVISLIFKYCDDHKLPLLDLKDFKKTLQYLTNEGKEEIKKEYGAISSTSTATIMRKIVALEEQGAEIIFGEKSFDVEDLLRKNKGKGYINILRLTDIQNRPLLFSTFMLGLMAEIYETFPEVGDVDKPKLIIFIDEAHLIFDQASKTLLDQIKNTIKLIRSKGVGIYFCTQSPSDIPNDILGQLGMKIQHSLRAFTAKDRQDIKLVAQNYPNTNFYKISEILTAMGTGQALVTVLNEKGMPTPVVDTLICTPESKMGTLTKAELEKIATDSDLVEKYVKTIDRESAYEILTKKLKKSETEASTSAATKKTGPGKTKKQKSIVQEIASSSVARQAGRTLVRELTRGLFGVLTKKTK